ncbi:transposase family protein [Streptomyces sp. NPDC021093]|uniref:transposase family protein n=1 Tax=Streptomyces sp. NPDC021093 TaxID=3365112 RepID=UPI00379B322C
MACDVELRDLLPHLSSVLVETAETDGALIRITARTADTVPVSCPACGQPSEWEHSRYVRRVADDAIGGRPVMINVWVRRLYCENHGCAKTTFVEQVDGLLTERYQCRTPALRRVVEACAVVLAGSAAARLLTVLHQTLTLATVLNCLIRPPRSA